MKTHSWNYKGQSNKSRNPSAQNIHKIINGQKKTLSEMQMWDDGSLWPVAFAGIFHSKPAAKVSQHEGGEC